MGIGDLHVALIYPSEDSPFSGVQSTGVFHIPDLESNLFSLRAMKAKGFRFQAETLKFCFFSEHLSFR